MRSIRNLWWAEAHPTKTTKIAKSAVNILNVFTR
ncbi:hypothetical protein NTHI1209_00791 [Haemophilus influenzae]|uniref:Uncharacterized protein n=1 Tax=Haemophilus influenzae TaxID=727 RepID=A0A158SWE4_HAEIF|nr:hypothetical protein NTHI1209_00791 [Haemophilus influenzae]